MKKPGIGVVIGRFQVPALHAGHVAIIDEALKHEETIIFLGVHPFPATKRNPLDFNTRKLMIEAHYPRDTIMILPLKDHANDYRWSEVLDSTIAALNPSDKMVTLYAGRDSFKPHYHGKYPIEDVPTLPCSGSELRFLLDKPTDSLDFRKGSIYTVNSMFNRVFCTIDAAVVRPNDPKNTNSEIEILIAKKPHMPTYCFVGGFVDIEDNSLEDAAIREIHEETGLLIDKSGLTCLGSQKINDWRNSSDTGIMTTFFVAQYQSGRAFAADDIAEVKWILFSEFKETYKLIMEKHSGLAEKLIKYLEKL